MISEDDLKNYTAVVRKPVVFDYKGYQVIGMPMPSSGGLLMQQMMTMTKYLHLILVVHQIAF